MKRLAQTFTIDNLPKEIVLFDKRYNTIWYVDIEGFYRDAICGDVVECYISYYNIEEREYTEDKRFIEEWRIIDFNDMLQDFGEILYIK